MADTTLYDVMVRYRIGDEARVKLGGIADAAAGAERSMGRLGSSMMTLGSLALGGAGLMGAKKAFIDFNSTIEQSKLTIASVDKMFSNRTFEQSTVVAEQFFDRYQVAAQKSTATTEEFLQMHSQLGPSLMRLGATQEQIFNTVKGSVIAAPTLGFRPEVAAMDIRSMLVGNVQQRDLFAKTLLDSIGVGVEQFNEKAKRDPRYALQIVNKALTQEAIQDAASAMEGSFAGVASTLKDTLEILGGKVGKPLFSAITAELANVNKYMADNAGEIERMAKAFGGGMVEGFRTVGSFLQILAENKESLIAIAGLYAGFQGVSMASSALGGLQAALTGLSVSASLGGASMASAAGAAMGVVGALAALYVGAQALAAFLDRWQSKEVIKQGDLGAVQSYIKGGRDNDAMAMYSYAKSNGLLDAVGDVDLKKAASHFHSLGYARSDILAQQAISLVNSRIAPAYRMNMGSPVEGPQAPEAKRESKAPAKVDIKIERIEVASDDPDRFAFGLVGAARRAAQRPTESAFSLPQGD